MAGYGFLCVGATTPSGFPKFGFDDPLQSLFPRTHTAQPKAKNHAPIATKPTKMGIIADFFSDWPHVLLLGVATLGGILVGIGVLKESERWSNAAIMVLAGIIIEPIATLGLFVYDEHISRALQVRIAELTAVAPRTLSAPDQNRIVEKLKPFAPASFELGTTQPLRHAFDIDSLDAQLTGVLLRAGLIGSGGTTWSWDSNSHKDDRPSGVWISAREGETDAASAADALVDALNTAGIETHRDVRPFSGPIPRKPPDPTPLPPGISGGSVIGTQYRNALSAQVEWKFLPKIQVLVGTKP